MASIIGEEAARSASSAASSESRWPISTVPVRSHLREKTRINAAVAAGRIAA